MHIGPRSPPRIRSTAGSHDGLPGELVIDAMLVIEVPSLRSPSAHRIGDPAKWDTIPEPLLDPLARGRLNTRPSGILARLRQDGQVAQLVEQRTENPRVGGSIPPLATNLLGSVIPLYTLMSPTGWPAPPRPAHCVPLGGSDRLCRDESPAFDWSPDKQSGFRQSRRRPGLVRRFGTQWERSL